VKILILKPSSLGDVIQALPVLRLLKKSRPESEIYWWLDSRLISLLEGDPDLSGVIPFEREAFGVPARWGRVWRSVTDLRRFRFDLVIDLQALARSAVTAWLANGTYTIGLDDPREGAAAFYDRAVPRTSPLTHAVDWYLSVLSRLGIEVTRDFQWIPERPEAVSVPQRRWQGEGRRWIVLQPGARWDNKRWPAQYYGEVARRLAGMFPWLYFVVLGSSEERVLGEAVRGEVEGRCLNVAGQTTLPEMVEWVRGAELMLSNDSGPMHVAAALSRPVVAMFGPTEPRRTGPYGQVDRVLRVDLPCVPCMKATCRWSRPLECLHAIRTEVVVERAAELLGKGGGG